MELILEQLPRRYWFASIETAAEFAFGFGGKPFPCLIWDSSGGRSQAELEALSSALIAAGMRNAVCGGIECERWHDAADGAFLNLRLVGSEYDAKYVMTTWHTGESPDEVGAFFVRGTEFDDHQFEDFLVLLVGENWTLRETLRDAIRSHADDIENSDDEESDESDPL